MLEYLWMMRNDGPGGGTGNAMSAEMEVSQRIGAMEMALETLVRMGVKSGTFTEEEFFAMAREIDEEDGVVDGRRDLRRMRRMCPSCGKPNGGTRTKCIWCAASLAEAKALPPENKG